MPKPRPVNPIRETIKRNIPLQCRITEAENGYSIESNDSKDDYNFEKKYVAKDMDELISTIKTIFKQNNKKKEK